MRGDALQTIRNITIPNTAFGRNSDCVPTKKRETSVNGYSETHISTTGLNPANQKLNDFLDNSRN